MVAVAFRLGVACHQRSMNIEVSKGPWATTFIGISPNDLQCHLDAINEVRI